MFLTKEHSQKGSDACITAVSLIYFSLCIANLYLVIDQPDIITCTW